MTATVMTRPLAPSQINMTWNIQSVMDISTSDLTMQLNT